MKIIFAGDYSLRGSGYETVIDGLARGLHSRGHHVVVYGLENRGDSHDRPYAVVSSDVSILRVQLIAAIREFKPDVLCVVGDLSLHEKSTIFVGDEWPIYAGIFAVEGAPMLNPSIWSTTIAKMDAAFTISEFGEATCAAANLKTTHLKIGIDDNWSPLTPEERVQYRKTLGLADKFVAITVADNNERKNLPAAFEAMGLLAAKYPEAFYVVVSKRRHAFIGWNLWDLVRRNGLAKNVFVNEADIRGIGDKQLRSLVSCSDVMLITSKAEGLCLPVLEAMACGVVPVVSDICGLPMLVDGRGLLIDREYTYVDSFGNTERSYVSAKHAAEQLERLLLDPELRARLATNCMSYAATRKWTETVDIFEEAIDEKIKTKYDERTPGDVADARSGKGAVTGVVVDIADVGKQGRRGDSRVQQRKTTSGRGRLTS